MVLRISVTMGSRSFIVAALCSNRPGASLPDPAGFWNPPGLTGILSQPGHESLTSWTENQCLRNNILPGIIFIHLIKRTGACEFLSRAIDKTKVLSAPRGNKALFLCVFYYSIANEFFIKCLKPLFWIPFSPLFSPHAEGVEHWGSLLTASHFCGSSP